MKTLIFIMCSLFVFQAQAALNCTASLYNKRTAKLVEQQSIPLFYDLPVALQIGSIEATLTLEEVQTSPDSFSNSLNIQPNGSTRKSESNVLHTRKEILRLDCETTRRLYAVYSVKDKRVVGADDLRSAYSFLDKEGYCVAGSMYDLAKDLDKAWYLPVAFIVNVDVFNFSFVEEIKETSCERWEENSDIPPGVSCAEGYQERVVSSRQITVNRCDLN